MASIDTRVKQDFIKLITNNGLGKKVAQAIGDCSKLSATDPFATQANRAMQILAAELYDCDANPDEVQSLAYQIYLSVGGRKPKYHFPD